MKKCRLSLGTCSAARRYDNGPDIRFTAKSPMVSDIRRRSGTPRQQLTPRLATLRLLPLAEGNRNGGRRQRVGALGDVVFNTCSIFALICVGTILRQSYSTMMCLKHRLKAELATTEADLLCQVGMAKKDFRGRPQLTLLEARLQQSVDQVEKVNGGGQPRRWSVVPGPKFRSQDSEQLRLVI